ncbi:intercellular trafficking and secretion [Dimargaris verticillata]|uniref:Sorting nexin-4 n=1 Tax=Dimargaris verticillata TaxID=2761393 RepID=A0A9W8B9E1_9FUNG|nr:intercellular trafficking and secretion [Dimargaris verticillata]
MEQSEYHSVSWDTGVSPSESNHLSVSPKPLSKPARRITPQAVAVSADPLGLLGKPSPPPTPTLVPPPSESAPETSPPQKTVAAIEAASPSLKVRPNRNATASPSAATPTSPVVSESQPRRVSLSEQLASGPPPTLSPTMASSHMAASTGWTTYTEPAGSAALHSETSPWSALPTATEHSTTLASSSDQPFAAGFDTPSATAAGLLSSAHGASLLTSQQFSDLTISEDNMGMPADPPSSSMTTGTHAQADTLESTCPYEITVSGPRKENEGTANAYMSYLVTSVKCVPHSTQTVRTALRRRFQDFVWLYHSLAKEYPACALPPLPGKYRMEYITGDRFGPEFVAKRQASLERFLVRVAHHPVLRTSHYFIVFLEARDWSSEYEEKIKAEGVLDNLSDAFLNAFSKIKKRDDRFVEIKDVVDKLEENLLAVERLYSRIGKRETDASLAYEELGKGLLELGKLESGLTRPLNQAGTTVLAFSEQLKSLTGGVDETYLSQVHEYIAYSDAFKTVLKLRDQKQVDFEELSHYLQTTIADRERVLHNRNASLGGFTSFLKGKYREMKGVDHEQLRQERLEKLDRKIKELEHAVDQSHDESTRCSDVVLNELETFQAIKTRDFKQHLGDMADHQIDFYDKAILTWEKLLPILENIEVQDS